MSYAETTTVPFDRSVSEIVTLLKRAGAERIGQMDDAAFYAIQFTMADRMIRFRIPLATEYSGPLKAGNGRAIDPKKVIEQARRQRGRALLLVIKAKLESVESGIETFEQAFLANVVLADGATVYDRIAAPIALEYQTGKPDPVAGLLPPPRENA